MLSLSVRARKRCRVSATLAIAAVGLLRRSGWVQMVGQRQIDGR
jgi:hypothetical protein